MNILPYIKLDNYKLCDSSIETYYQHFKKYTDNILYRDNAGTSPKVTTVYGHDDFIKENQGLVDYKNKTLVPIAEDFCNYFNLNVTYNVFILVTKADRVLEWHKDGAGSAGYPQAAFMYDFRNTERAPTMFDYNDQIYTLNGYKAALINTATMHKVDNTNYGNRYNLRISLYGKSYEEIYETIQRKLAC